MQYFEYAILGICYILDVFYLRYLPTAAIMPIKQYRPRTPPTMLIAQPMIGIQPTQLTTKPPKPEITKYKNIAIINVTISLAFTASFIGKNEFIIDSPP